MYGTYYTSCFLHLLPIATAAARPHDYVYMAFHKKNASCAQLLGSWALLVGDEWYQDYNINTSNGPGKGISSNLGLLGANIFLVGYATRQPWWLPALIYQDLIQVMPPLFKKVSSFSEAADTPYLKFKAHVTSFQYKKCTGLCALHA